MAEDIADYRDDFGDGGYKGSDGSLHWSTSWTEDGTDDGSPASGAVHVGRENCSNNECLHLESGLLASLRARRAADLSMFDTARLSFDMHIDPPLLPTEILDVQVRGGGAGWTTIGSYPLSLYGGEHQKSYDISDFIGGDFELRFRVTGLVDGDLTIDRVSIAGALVSSSSTTSSTTSTSTSTSSSSTTSTSAPRTSPSTTSISTSSTSSTAPSSTSTSAPPPSPSSTTSTTTGDRPAATTSTTPARSTAAGLADTTTTTAVATTSTTQTELVVGIPVSGGGSDGGLRDPGVGLISDYEPGMMGDMSMEQVEVLGAELDADFSLAVEVFDAVKVWGAALAMLIAAALVAGVDRRRFGRLRSSA